MNASLRSVSKDEPARSASKQYYNVRLVAPPPRAVFWMMVVAWVAGAVPSARAEWVAGAVHENCDTVCNAMTPTALCDVT